MDFGEENARKIIEEGKNSYKKYLEAEGRKRISTVNMEMKMNYNKELDGLLDSYVKKVIELIAKMRNTEIYRNYIRKSVEKGKNELGGDVKIIISSRDKDLIPNEKNVEYSSQLDNLGGVILESKDGKKRADYSIATLVEENILEIKRQIYEIIKGEI